MNGNPVDPIPFERARKEILERLAAEAGFDLWSYQGADDDGLPASASRSEQEEQYEHLWQEADVAVWGAAMVGRLRAWVADGDGWRRVPQEAVRDRSLRAPDEPWGLYVDRFEIGPVDAARRPNGIGAETAATLAGGKPDRPVATGKSGRRKGEGYSLKDIPSFEKILSAQRESGDVETQYALVKKFAGDVNSPSYNANVDRLRRGLPKWLEKNGHQWRRSI